jgi:predicted PurR-regulated permease PerM
LRHEAFARVTESSKPRVVVLVDARSVAVAAGALLGLAAAVKLVLLAQSGLTLIAIALFLAVALDPAVERFERRGLGRVWSVAAVYSMALALCVCLGLVFVPLLVEQVTRLVDALPDLVADLTRGHGPLGFLETRYHVVEQVRSATESQGAGGVLGDASSALSAAKDLVTTLAGLVIIAVLTFFMLLEGPQWRRRATELVPVRNRATVERIGSGVYRAIGGFVTGNLLASLLAGAVATTTMLLAGVPYAIPLGLFVAIIELVPYVGAVVAVVLVSGVALTHDGATALIVFVLLSAYQVVEGHTVRPLIYRRTVKISPLTVLLAIVVGTEIAGILGALAAIPIAGSIRVIALELLRPGTERDDASAPNREGTPSVPRTAGWPADVRS